MINWDIVELKVTSPPPPPLIHSGKECMSERGYRDLVPPAITVICCVM